MKERHELEEGFWNSRPKQRHINCYRLAFLLPRLGLNVDLKGIQLVRRDLDNGRVVLV